MVTLLGVNDVDFMGRSDRAYYQVEVGETNFESFVPPEAGHLDGLPRNLFSWDANNTSKEMMLVKEPESCMALLSSTPFIFAVT